MYTKREKIIDIRKDWHYELTVFPSKTKGETLYTITLVHGEWFKMPQPHSKTFYRSNNRKEYAKLCRKIMKRGELR